MAWKPYRGSGVNFDKYSKREDFYWQEYQRLFNKYDPHWTPQRIKEFSKAMYYYWYFDIKAREAIGIGKRRRELPIMHLEMFRLLRENEQHLYSKIATVFNEQKSYFEELFRKRAQQEKIEKRIARLKQIEATYSETATSSYALNVIQERLKRLEFILKSKE